MKRIFFIRTCVVVTVLLGFNYIIWRWFFSLNWRAWWIAVPLVCAETYNFVDVLFFGFTIWRADPKHSVHKPADGLTVDVFITTYNEPIELVIATAKAAQKIRYPHLTWILDDGARDEMRLAAQELGVGYVKRGENWRNRPLHAKAGNLNNALMATSGEFMLILDADQVPYPEILDHTLYYFEDPKVALVQTPQWFGNVSPYDPLGSQAPLFYGPIQQGKNAWNAAFFCGSNAILRREALMQLGLKRYATELEIAVKEALRTADRILVRTQQSAAADIPEVQTALKNVEQAIAQTRAAIGSGETIADATYALQQRIAEVSKEMVKEHLHLMAEDLAAIKEIHTNTDENWDVILDVEKAADLLSSHELSPLGALEAVSKLLRSLDVDRSDEAQPLMPLATVSVTEDMATSMRLHAMGWKSYYHHETLAVGLAPEDLSSMLKQRLRWAQGTVQVMLRENPLVQKGLSLAQKLMYFATMWSYLSGFAAIVYFTAPVVYLCFGVLPVKSFSTTYFFHFIPFMIANQLLFFAVSKGISTWRGQQYSLALFPIWIKAVVSAYRNVFFHHPLAFVVTPKTGNGVRNEWRLIRVQIVVAIVLIIAAVIGIIRLAHGLSEPVGTFVNVAWVIWDLGLMSILIPAVRFRGHRQEETLFK